MLACFILSQKNLTCYYCLLLGNYFDVVLSGEEYVISKRPGHHNASKTLHGGNIIICSVYNILVCCLGLNSSAFTLPNLATLTAKDNQKTAPSILREVLLAKKYIKITRVVHSKGIVRLVSKSFKTGIVPIARNSDPLPKLSINCSKIVNTNHPIKIKHFDMLCTI